ncbi:centaurin-gamma-1A isoform X1 [Planococcus citri]|uniref:centaurin-gamma-1A isoform X1 n=1 Tax=Planococcus citri TaxID=170843 RepID=UPI0031FA48DD
MMNTKSNIQTYINNSVAIRQEIQRFESVHPSIYAIYDLIELIPDAIVAQQIRDHVVCIEDSFVNSQEWTLSRSVPDLRVGIVGSLSSGKSALVHRYLTGSYMQEESPEGGRFKKEVVIDGQSHLLLIRDEGGLPELQFTSWVDAVIFVFSLENEASFNSIYSYYAELSHYRNTADKDIPIILVGTQDAITETNPRVIDDARARKLATDLKRCTYYETCATYGLNVERVFQDACQKIIQQRLTSSVYSSASDSRPATPGTPSTASSMSLNHFNSMKHLASPSPSPCSNLIIPTTPYGVYTSPNSPNHLPYSMPCKDSLLNSSRINLTSSIGNLSRHPQELTISLDGSKQVDSFPKDLPTPSSTPTTSRKIRRRSNLFMTSSKKGEDKLKNGELGSGRAIPLKQGYLYKKSNKTLNKDWKKKYVTLCDDGRLTYHPSLHDYMEEVHGKEISLQYVTVKIPGQKPRGSKTVNTSSINDSFVNFSISNSQYKEKRCSDKVFLTAYEVLKEPNSKVTGVSEDSVMIMSNNSLTFTNGYSEGKAETPHVKKRHRRLKSANVKNQDNEDYDGYEFLIVSLDNKQWKFEASSIEERNEWVAAIEQQILASLQGNESNKGKSRLNSSLEAATILSIRTCVPGNSACVDCNAPNPDWASLNIGVLMCIECSGIHRNLGSHISKVRSLDLDEWPPGHLSVMLSIGNSLANSVWEAGASSREKPSSKSKREQKEQWIKSKYETKEFLPSVPNSSSITQQLAEAILRNDMRMVVLLLAHATVDDINAPINSRDLRRPLHVACSVACLPIAQLLLWHNADVKIVDHEGRTCLSYVHNAKPQSDSNGASVAILKDLLINSGCPDSNNFNGKSNNCAGTLSRQKNHVPPLDKLPSSVI